MTGIRWVFPNRCRPISEVLSEASGYPSGARTRRSTSGDDSAKGNLGWRRTGAKVDPHGAACNEGVEVAVEFSAGVEPGRDHLCDDLEIDLEVAVHRTL